VLTEVMQLRKKYDDLVQFTVQLTTERERIEAERNSLKDQLDKAKKAAPKAAAAAAGGAVAQANAPAGFNLMHAVILAFISFVVGRFLA
jgi:peptidoglycan hydrolase CwlO-like protein